MHIHPHPVELATREEIKTNQKSTLRLIMIVSLTLLSNEQFSMFPRYGFVKDVSRHEKFIMNKCKKKSLSLWGANYDYRVCSSSRVEESLAVFKLDLKEITMMKKKWNKNEKNLHLLQSSLVWLISTFQIYSVFYLQANWITFKQCFLKKSCSKFIKL